MELPRMFGNKNIIKKLFFLFVFTLSTETFAGLYYHHSLNYHSNSDDVEQFSYNTTRNIIFLGASLGKSNQIIIGWNAAIWSKTHKGSSSSTESQLSLTELGPRITYYFNQTRTFALSAAYHPYVNGTRTTAATGQEEKISGSAIYLSASLHLKVTKRFFVGAAIVYHTTSISKSVVGTTETETSQSYSNIYPAIEFSFRFK